MNGYNVKVNKQLHSDEATYGGRNDYFANENIKGSLEIPSAIGRVRSKYPIRSILDFGAGKGGLIKALQSNPKTQSLEVYAYDPAVDEYSKKLNDKVDITTCIDVLEHIPQKDVNATLREIGGLTNGFLFFGIDLLPAKKTLIDGRNAHILIAPADWWCQQICAQFCYSRFFQKGHIESGEKYPCHLFGWASNNPRAQDAANIFVDSMKILQKKWVLRSDGSGMAFLL